MDAVSSRVVPLAIEDDHRVLTTVEDINVVVSVNTDAADLLERPPIGQPRPLVIDAVFELAASDDHRKLRARARASIRDRSIATPIVIRKLRALASHVVRPMPSPYAMGQ